MNRWPHSGLTTPRKAGKRRKTMSDILAGHTACAQVASGRNTVYGPEGHDAMVMIDPDLLIAEFSDAAPKAGIQRWPCQLVAQSSC
jgi:hypothetical protein